MFLKMIPVTKWSCAGVRPEAGLGEEPEPVCEGCSQVRVVLVVMMMVAHSCTRFPCYLGREI